MARKVKTTSQKERKNDDNGARVQKLGTCLFCRGFRFSFFRYISAQIIDDRKEKHWWGKRKMLKAKKNETERAYALGEYLAQKRARKK